METSLMSESLVDTSDVDETVTQVLTYHVQDGGDEHQRPMELLQEQVELHLEYSGCHVPLPQLLLPLVVSKRLDDSVTAFL